MKVYKFGGASVKNAWGVKNLGDIVRDADDKLVVVVSALGKTTNKLEKLTASVLEGKENALSLFEDIRIYHLELAADLLGKEEAERLLDPMFGKAEDIMSKMSGSEYDHAYDQLVSQGELWSTAIVEGWLRKSGMNTCWIDVRNYLITDSRFRDARVDWQETESRISTLLENTDKRIIVTQGFIGGTSAGETTTLGREGSDYTAAIIANVSDASDVTIWKDVPGVLNADPDWMDQTEKLDNISYKEAVELSFSGAKVIHPKTIKPLHNKCIPLYVKSFLNPGDKGTIVSVNDSIDQEVPVFVKKEKQVLISFIPKDLSFAIGDNLGILFKHFNDCGIKTNLVQASAVSLAVCIDKEENKISRLSSLLHDEYKILVNKDVEMLSLRYYNKKAIETITGGREILIEQRTRKAIRYVVK